MTFTLTDPRFQALSQAGGNFGQGLGNELVSFIENQRLQNALSGGDQNDPYQMIQRFAQNRVSPAQQEMYFNPVVQNRLAQQNSLKILQEGLKNVKSNDELAVLLAQVQAAQGKDIDAKSIIDLYRSRNIGDDYGPEGQNPNAPNSQTNTSPMQPGVKNPAEQYPGVGQYKPDTSIASPGLLGNIPPPVKTQLLTADAIANMRRKYVKKYGEERGNALVNQKVADNQTQYNNEVTQRDEAVKENEQALNRQDRAKKFVGDRIAAKYQGNSNYLPVLTEMAKDLTTKTYKDSEEAAFAEVDAKYIDPLMQKINSIDQKIPSSKLILNSLDSSQKQDLLERVNVDVNEMLKDVPEAYKKEVYDQVRQKLAAKNGLGVIGADYAMSFPGQKLKARMNAIGPAPKARVVQAGGGGFGFVSNPAYAKQLATAEKKLIPLLKAELPRTPATILKDLYVDGLGYPDKSFDDALSKVIQEGDIIIPSHLQSAYQDVKKSFSPTPLEYLNNEGIRARGEFYK